MSPKEIIGRHVVAGVTPGGFSPTKRPKRPPFKAPEVREAANRFLDERRARLPGLTNNNVMFGKRSEAA